MFNAYDRVKKHRALARQESGSSSSNEESMGEPSNSQNESLTHSEAEQRDEERAVELQPDRNDYDEDYDVEQLVSSDADNDSSLNEQSLEENDEHLPADLKKDLRVWAIQNIGNLKNKTITDLLKVLRNNGHINLPKTAETLLKTARLDPNAIRIMQDCRGHYGKYVYLGLERELAKRIAPDTFFADTIEVLVNIDGLPLYQRSTKQCWPILVKVYSTAYTSSPFVVGLFSGDSKPANVNAYLEDFVLEAAYLTHRGIQIREKSYNFKIKAFICDTPARAFIKCVKSHGGFFACERCTVKGISVNSRRVYSRTDCTTRTHDTFAAISDQSHHMPGLESPLLRIPNFDIVHSVLLDSMHLLFLGVMKALLHKWKDGNPLSRISVLSRQALAKMLNAFESHIPTEFQRKTFDLTNLSNWKATQFRFFLLYCGPLVLGDVLPDEKYKHFLLLHTACRMLCTADSAVASVDYAKILLVKFFQLMPTLYGTDSQVINFHNLRWFFTSVTHFFGSTEGPSRIS